MIDWLEKLLGFKPTDFELEIIRALEKTGSSSMKVVGRGTFVRDEDSEEFAEHEQLLEEAAEQIKTSEAA